MQVFFFNFFQKSEFYEKKNPLIKTQNLLFIKLLYTYETQAFKEYF